VASTKKQIIIAALVIVGLLVVAAIALGTFGYFRYYKPLVQPLVFVSGAGRLEGLVRNAAPFEPPASGDVTPAQWSKYRDVTAAVVAALPASMGVVEAQKRSLQAAAAQQGGRVPFRVALAAFGEIGPAFLKAKQAQVDALNRAEFSVAEFRWVQRQVFAAADLPLAELDLEGMRTAPQEGRDYVDVKKSTATEVSQAVRDRVRSRPASEVETWLALAYFGL
jgi:hypothetical protein